MKTVDFSKMRRIIFSGGLYFITNVTNNRHQILINNIEILWYSFDSIKTRNPHNLFAWVILPEHFHLLVTPHNDNISGFMHDLKLSFSVKYRNSQSANSGPVWQRRFWDHIIRDEKDLARHLDYIHFNPVKHGYVKEPHDWPYSSINNFKDDYPLGWGGCDDFIEGFGE